MKTHNNKDQDNFVFREVQTPEELLELCKLRYNVYRNSRLSNLCPENPQEMDFDNHDLHSRHFGLFHVIDGHQRIVGCQRGVYPSDMHTSQLAASLAASVPGLADKVAVDQISELPCLSYMPKTEVGILQEHIKHLRETGQSYAESTRFMLDPAVSNVKLAIFMARAVIAAYIFSDLVDVGITQVVSSHKRLYLRNGFRQLYSTIDQLYSAIGLKMSTLAINRENVSGLALESISQMTSLLATHSCICFETVKSVARDAFWTNEKPITAAA